MVNGMHVEKYEKVEKVVYQHSLNFSSAVRKFDRSGSWVKEFKSTDFNRIQDGAYVK